MIEPNAEPTVESIHPVGLSKLILWEDHRLLDVTAANLSINQP